MAERRLPPIRAVKSVAAQAQVTVDTDAPFTQIAGLFDNLADVANASLNQSVVQKAQEKAATDLRNNPQGVPALQAGTSLAASTYNTTAKQLYAVQNDSETMAHMSGLEVEFEANPAGYREASDAYLQSKIKSTGDFDPAQALRLQAKFSLLQETTLPKLQKQADNKLAERQQAELNLFGQATQNTVDSVTPLMFDPNHSEKVTRQLAMLGQNLQSTMTSAIDPRTQEPKFTPAEVDAALRSFWSNATEDGLLSQIPRLSDEDLIDWQEKMTNDSFTMKFFSDEGSADISLSKIMTADKRRFLLGQVERQISARGSASTEVSFQQKVDFRQGMDDALVVLGNGGSPEIPTAEQAQAMGITPSGYTTFLENVNVAQNENEAKYLNYNNTPVQIQNEIRSLESALGKGDTSGSQAMQIKIDSLTEEAETRAEALLGKGNGVEYIFDNNPAMVEIFKKFDAGEISFSEYSGALNVEFDRLGVPKESRDYLPDESLQLIASQFKLNQDFTDSNEETMGTYGDELWAFVQRLREDFGDSFFGVSNQLFRDEKIPKDYQAMMFANPQDVNGLREFGDAIANYELLKKDIKPSEIASIRKLAKDAVSQIKESLPSGQSGTLRVMDTIVNSIEKLTLHKMNNGKSKQEAVKEATKLFTDPFNFIPARNESIVAVPVFRKDSQGNPVRRSDSEMKFITKGINLLDQISQGLSSNIEFFSTLTLKPNQKLEDAQEDYNTRVIAMGQWKSTADGLKVRLYEPGGIPVQYKGADGGIRMVEVSYDEVGNLGATRVPISRTIGGRTTTTAPKAVIDSWLEQWLEKDLLRKTDNFVGGEE